MNHISTLLVSASGVGAIELAQQVPLPQSHDTGEIIKVIIQLVIGVATLFGLFKKKTPQTL